MQQSISEKSVEICFERIPVEHLRLAIESYYSSIPDKIDLIKSLQNAFAKGMFSGLNVKSAYYEGADLNQAIIHFCANNADARQLERINEIIEQVKSSYRFLKIYFNLHLDELEENEENDRCIRLDITAARAAEGDGSEVKYE